MTDPGTGSSGINIDDPEQIEPTLESAATPEMAQAPVMQVLSETPDGGVTTTDRIQLSDLSMNLLYELVLSGNEAAAREFEWRMNPTDTPKESA